MFVCRRRPRRISSSAFPTSNSLHLDVYGALPGLHPLSPNPHPCAPPSGHVSPGLLLPLIAICWSHALDRGIDQCSVPGILLSSPPSHRALGFICLPRRDPKTCPGKFSGNTGGGEAQSAVSRCPGQACVNLLSADKERRRRRRQDAAGRLCIEHSAHRCAATLGPSHPQHTLHFH